MPRNAPGLPPTSDPRCGTTAGYKAHRKRGEMTCQPCRDAMTEYQRSSMDPEAHTAYMRAYYARNQDKIRAQARAWYANNTERARAAGRNYRAANPERRREENRRWRAANLGKARESARAWRRRNPDKAREVERRRRAARLGNGVQRYVEDDVLALYGTLCHICGLQIDLAAPRRIGRDGWESGLHIDHLLPIALGGSDSLENVRPAHGLCNVSKGTATA